MHSITDLRMESCRYVGLCTATAFHERVNEKPETKAA